MNVLRLVPDSKLLIRRCSSIENRADVSYLPARAEIIYHIVNKLEQFTNKLPNGNFGSFAEIDHLAAETVPHSAPFVLFNQHFVMQPESEIPIQQLIDLSDHRLKERGNSDRVINPRGNIADAKLQGGEKRMRPNIPVDLLTVVDATGFDQ